MKTRWLLPAAFIAVTLLSCNRKSDLVLSPLSCAEKATAGIRPLADARDARFQGKVSEDAALCRGDVKAAERRSLPWVDWRNYYPQRSIIPRMARVNSSLVEAT
jgi:hypothetical protein